MCGLIGALVSADVQVFDRLDRGLASLRHRGPDYRERRKFRLAGHDVWLGFTRLSIIDLSSDANQPMCSDDGRYALIFNGEIYNYVELRAELQKQGVVFRTVSDTEVLLKAWIRWGENCLRKLDGMFAFVIIDVRDATLTCVRDPFGIKPFFYSVQNGSVYFASEMPAILDLLPSRPMPDLQCAYDYLVHADYESTERTFVEGVCHLMPGHVLTVDVATGRAKLLHMWWSPSIEQTSRLTFDDAAEAVRDQFLLNVKRQLRSDVPLGVALSGGIDSSAVVCAIRHLEPDVPIHTFSFIADEATISEERWINFVNQHVSAISHKVNANAEDLKSDIDDMIGAQGEPFGSTSIYAQYRVFKLARESGITVTLDGQGADELLAGYNGYPGYRILSLLSEGKGLSALRFARAWHKWPGRSYNSIVLDVTRALFPDAIYGRVRAAGGRKFIPKWLNLEAMNAAGVRFVERRQRAGPVPRGRRLVQQLSSSLQYRGLPSLLRHGDRNAMHFSIESRVPFLTTGLSDLLYSLPEEFLISAGGETKSIFRAAMRGIVPDAVLDRSDKVGFATPERDWLFKAASTVNAWLIEGEKVPFLNTGEVLRVFSAMISGRVPFSWQIWRFVNYIRWWNLVF